MAGLCSADRLWKLQIEGSRTRENVSGLEIDARMPSEIKAISPLVDRLMRLIAETHCVPGEEPGVELALRAALNNAVVHGNRFARDKMVQVRCRCEVGKGVSIVVKDEGEGFHTETIPDPSASENVEAERGRNILLMKSQMDEVFFESGGAEVHMQKKSSTERKK
jgi:serine/threonine-protein kinase RsbW